MFKSSLPFWWQLQNSCAAGSCTILHYLLQRFSSPWAGKVCILAYSCFLWNLTTLFARKIRLYYVPAKTYSLRSRTPTCSNVTLIFHTAEISVTLLIYGCFIVPVRPEKLRGKGPSIFERNFRRKSAKILGLWGCWRFCTCHFTIHYSS